MLTAWLYSTTAVPVPNSPTRWVGFLSPFKHAHINRATIEYKSHFSDSMRVMIHIHCGKQITWSISPVTPITQRHRCYKSESRSVLSNSLRPHELYSPWNSPGQTTGVGILSEWVAFPFSSGSSQPRDRTQVSCIAGGFFTSWATIPQYINY